MKKKFWGSVIVLCVFSPALFADELVIFHKAGCRPCAHLKKTIEENPDLMRGFKVSYVNTAQDHGAAKLFNISSVPTIVRLDDKTREVSRVVGAASKREVAQWLERHNSK